MSHRLTWMIANPYPSMVKGLSGKLFGDKGYISKALFEALFEDGLQLITWLRKNMKNALMPMSDKILLRKRSLIETINDQLKNISQIEHSRHRSVANFMFHGESSRRAHRLYPPATKTDAEYSV